MTQVRAMRADARRNYERLLKVAAEAFAEHGEGASLDDIAKRALPTTAQTALDTANNTLDTVQAALASLVQSLLDVLAGTPLVAVDGVTAGAGAATVLVL